jgi:uncharacterized protein YndB with AHSA1/START domain
MTHRFSNTTQVSLPSDTSIRVTRDFDAPRRLLWRAHVEPALFQQWIGGYPGWSMPVCEMDVRVGGRYRWRWRQDVDGKEFGFFGEYLEVDAPAKLVSAEFFDPGSFGGEMSTSRTINRTLFSEQDGVTTLVIELEYESMAARDAAIASGMTDGMEKSFARLDVVVERAAGDGDS